MKMANTSFRPRILYASTFIWLTCVGGRFLSPFLEHEAGLSSEQIGAALALQQLCITFTSSLGGAWADHLEGTYPKRSKVIVIGIGVIFSTLAFLLHGMQYILPAAFFKTVTWHTLLQAVYGIAISLVWPVLDSLTIVYLKNRGQRQNYGEERLHGPIWWAVANLIISPLLDRFGFVVCYPLGVVTLATVIITLVMYDSSSMQQISFSEVSDEHQQDAEINEVSNVEPLQLPELLRILLTGGPAFLTCLVCVSSGQAVVDNLVFLFFEGLGSSWVLMGLSVVVKIAFEVPVFYYGELLLKKYGAAMVLVIGSVCYVVRAIAYTYIPVDYVLLLEPLHGITYGCVLIAMVDFAAQILPPGNDAFGQGLVYSFREGGSVLGVFFGGWADKIFGPRTMFRFSALFVFVGTAILSTSLWTDRRSAVSAAPIENLDMNEEIECSGVDEAKQDLEFDQREDRVLT